MELEKVIWETAAAVLCKERGEAPAFAERQARAALDEGDVVGHGRWLSVVEAICELVRPPDEEDTLN